MTAAPSEPVRNLVTRPPVLVHLDDSLRRVAELFVEESFGAAVVRGTDPPAIISERDIVRAVAEGMDLDRTHVEEVMTEDAAVAAPLDTVADVGGEDADPRFGQAEGRRDGAPHGEGDLRRDPDREAAGRVGGGEDAAGLDGDAEDARVGELGLHHRVRLGEASRRVPDPRRRDAGPVVGPPVVDEGRPRGERRLDAGDGGARLVLDPHGLGGIGGPVGIVGDHDRHRLAQVPHHVPDQDGLRIRAEGRARQEGGDGSGRLGEVGRRERRDDAREAARGADVDGHDPRVRARAPHDGEMRHPREPEVVEVPALPQEKAEVLLPLHRPADQRRGVLAHGAPLSAAAIGRRAEGRRR